MKTLRAKLIFSAPLLLQPLFPKLITTFSTIRIELVQVHVDRNEPNSWMIVEITGRQEVITQTLAWLKGKGMKVESAQEVRLAATAVR